MQTADIKAIKSLILVDFVFIIAHPLLIYYYKSVTKSILSDKRRGLTKD